MTDVQHWFGQEMFDKLSAEKNREIDQLHRQVNALQDKLRSIHDMSSVASGGPMRFSGALSQYNMEALRQQNIMEWQRQAEQSAPVHGLLGGLGGLI